MITDTSLRPDNCLTSLPFELLDHIISFLLPADLICLGVTCHALLAHLYNDITRLLKEDTAPWAGHRIITLGDHAYTMPPNLLTYEEETELREALDVVKNDRRRTTPAGPLYSGSEDLYSLGKCNTMFNQVIPKLNVTEQKIISTLRPLMPSSKQATTSSQQPDDWILRNLMKRQYVRASVLARLCPDVPANGPFIEPVGFGELIVGKTIWTDDRFSTDSWRIHGEWAGDRFDIIPFSDFSEENGWKDVRILSARALHQNLMDKIHEYRYRNHRVVGKEMGNDTDTHVEGEDDWQDEYAWLDEGGYECDVPKCRVILETGNDMMKHKTMHWQESRSRARTGA